MTNKKIFKVCLILGSFIFIYFFTIQTPENIAKEQIPMRSYRTEKDSHKTSCVANKHSVCFIGKRFCHPGYTGERCNERLEPANPWYTDCPNLKQDVTFDIDMGLEMFRTKDNCGAKERSSITGCANLCFSHPVSGVPQVPIAFWKIVNEAESSVWKSMGTGSDRGAEHLEGFDKYKALQNDLGDFIEIGSGPFTQTQFIIKRNFKSITLLDPGINNYLKQVPGCTYKDKTLRGKQVRLLSYGAEKLSDDDKFGKFDTVLSINVIDHVWDAYQFLGNIYKALKPGGILIFHDRFSPNPNYLDKALGPGNHLHPVRVSRGVFNHFFEQFEEIYMFEGQTTEMIKRMGGEVGFYFIGRKKF